LDTSDFSDEYWLKREGFIAGNSRLNILMYHPDVSSIQLDTKRKLAIFNLDYAPDHPLLYFPLMKKSEGKFVDRSYSVNTGGSQLKGELVFTATKVQPKLPRLLNNPNGFLSALSWTEHADYTD